MSLTLAADVQSTIAEYTTTIDHMRNTDWASPKAIAHLEDRLSYLKREVETLNHASRPTD